MDEYENQYLNAYGLLSYTTEMKNWIYDQIDYIRQVPFVSSSDNGKILRVVNGAWAAVHLPSASGVSF